MNSTDYSTTLRGGVPDPWTDRLSDYLDEDMPGPDRRQVEEHLATCAECSAVLEDLRQVVARAPGLAVPSDPERDLWPGIHDRLRDRPRALTNRRFMMARLPVLWRNPFTVAAAATLGIACVALAVWLSPRQPGRIPDASSPAPVAVRAWSEQSERDYQDSLAELRRIVRTRLTRDPRVVEVIEDNLAVIDMAIAQYQDALVQQPGNAVLGERLAAARNRKLTVLRQAAALASDGAN